MRDLLKNKGVVCGTMNVVLGTTCSDKNEYTESVTREEFIELFGCKPESPKGQNISMLIMEEDREVFFMPQEIEVCEVSSFVKSNRRRN